ncbi:MarR family transcriptional regulator [Gordonibacter sp. 28C]|uniref:MarR family transcriptional regulator n=1 Tax=Gordonibacter sp. 28C TaxID=2078569 RepID=UPI001314D1A4|nr:MarR family transcriptional regulator [Gordonibacter sp. 28C]
MEATARDTRLDYVVDTFSHASYLSMAVLNARLLERAILSNDVTPTQYRILIRLVYQGGSLRIGELAEMLDLGASTVTASVSQLVEMGEAIRVKSTADQRNVHVILTSAGQRRAAQVDAAIRPLLETMRNRFPLDLRRYASVSTLMVADERSLFGAHAMPANVNTALCDEILFTANLASHITRDEGLSLNEYRLLLGLLDHTEGAHPCQMTRELNMMANSLAMAQGELARRQLIACHRDAVDKRSVLMEITSDGYATLDRTARAMREGLTTLIRPGLTHEDLVKHQRLAEGFLAAGGSGAPQNSAATL